MDRNNFDGVRIGLALIVVFAHLAVLTAIPAFKPLEAWFDANFAVRGFFAISGFLVTRSWLSSTSLADYAGKRWRRIYPAYITAVLLCLGIGMATTSLSLGSFVSDLQTWRYLGVNALFLNFLQHELPGALTRNPFQTLNGALWTIKVEVMLYCCVPGMVWASRRWGVWPTFAILFAGSVAWVYGFTHGAGGALGEELARQFPGQMAYFACGAVLAQSDTARARLGWLALTGLAALVLVSNPTARLIIDPLAYASIVIWLAESALPNLRLGRLGDLSYGLYLYHFPIIQALIYAGLFQTHPWWGLMASLSLTLLAALLSWHLIEKRWLRRNSHYLRATAG